MQLIDRVMSRPEFRERPPVLVEIGASGGTHAAWKRIAQWSVCVAFDPDSRDMQCVEKESSGYRGLFIQPAAAVAGDLDEAPFYLTRSPYCSSLLRPDAESLADWDFAPLFEVERTARVRCVRLSAALKNLGIDQVDWFKTDSQGTDLRLFLSLGDSIARRVLAAEFEPGLIDAYHEEDKLSAVLAAMDRREFWVSDLRILGTLRISAARAGRWSPRDRQLAGRVLKRSPGWAEMTCLNTLRGAGPFGPREWMLSWVIATLREQHGFALDLAERARETFDDPIFGELAAASDRQIEAALRRGRPWFILGEFGRRVAGFARRKLRGK